jgi:hypothetical protein
LLSACGRGGIGIRAALAKGLIGAFGKAVIWEFESPRPHHSTVSAGPCHDIGVGRAPNTYFR